jgi:hypothetical protein
MALLGSHLTPLTLTSHHTIRLLEAEVLDWVWVSGGVDKAETEANLASQIDAQKNPTSAAGVPWA